MPALKKPTLCDRCYEETECESSDFKHLFKPERWVCKECDHVQVERPQRNDPNKCRECDAKRGEKEFAVHSNICLECKRSYNDDYYEDNKDQIRQWHRDDRKKRPGARQEQVRKAVQRSPESFIRHLMQHIRKKSNHKKVKLGKLNPACLDVTIDFDYLWGLWEAQDGRCALSELPMMHEFNNLCSISVDRVDSEVGYVRGNVQLVCKWVNLAKGSHGNEEFLGLIDNVRAVRT